MLSNVAIRKLCDTLNAHPQVWAEIKAFLKDAVQAANETLVLKGGYVDVSELGRDTLRLGSIRFRHATHRHYVEVRPSGAWTLLLTSNVVRPWGFWVKGVFKRPLRYFGKFGHPPCDEQ